MQEATDFEEGFKTAGAETKDMVANLRRQGTKVVPKTRDIGLVGEGGQSEELNDLIQGTWKKVFVECCLHCRKSCLRKTSNEGVCRLG